MAKRNRGSTYFTIQKRLHEGRGRGVGANYRPWLQVQDVPSTGLSSRITGWKTGRSHHLFSRLETNYFFILDWCLTVSDVREQFPLLPQEETIAISEKIGVRHPTDPRTQYPIVMTSDFLISVPDGGASRQIVRTVKPSAQLVSERVLQKFEIERLYWEARGISWGVVTEMEIPLVVAKNVEWVHRYNHIKDFSEFNILQLRQIEEAILAHISDTQPLAEITSRCDHKLGLALGTSLTAVRHFIATRRWIIDMNVTINPSRPLKIVDVPGRAIAPRLIERSFRKVNDQLIHWLPGHVDKKRERGERDHRLDAVLDIHQFTELVIRFILQHNRSLLQNYRPDEFMIGDQVELRPTSLWQWGIVNRTGHLRYQDANRLRLNLLPSETGTVTQHGIRFKRLLYSCERARCEQWFVRARAKGDWRVGIAYDPRSTEVIYLRIPGQTSPEACHLLECDQRLRHRTWVEVDEVNQFQKEQKEIAATADLQAEATHRTQVEAIIEQGRALTAAAQRGQSKRQRILRIRENRREERQFERLRDATTPALLTNGAVTNLVPAPGPTFEDNADDAGSSVLKMLREKRDQQWNQP